ncbi:response regulator [Sulfuriroseicoccus oceanibius]|uniref:Response regulator transcription factor n=1 Tax=Sulfuriroseicoccus oceanibius TaxID=2707525 RepID=A0A6B3LDC4_9BACT|nr:response regulator transcription factor [Sulfuriroseicoccus oceanibius]QQL45814.1 response regulator transcription factor [Sulfuriroseicoccus oceanibius]
MTPHPPRATTNVWVVEDSDAFRLELTELLDDEPTITCQQSFSTAEDALAALATNPAPDVMLVDIQLPGANGIELIRQVNASHPALCTIVLTISENRQTVVSAICAGASGYLLKNDDFSDIVDGIHMVADGGSPLSGAIASMVLELFKKAPPAAEDQSLSEKEIKILNLLADGEIKKEIAYQLGIAPVTVDYHLRNIYKKLHVNSQAGAVGKALRNGLI